MRTAKAMALAAVAATAAAAEGQVAVAPADAGDLRRPPFVFASPPVINVSASHLKDTLAEGDLAWTYTGVLAKSVDLHRGIYGTVTIPAGERFYGIPLSGPDTSTGLLSWCSPKADESSKLWSATCLISIEGGYVLERPMYPPFTLTALYMPKLVGPNAKDVLITRQDVDFGVKVHIEYLVHKFSNSVLLLDKRVSVPGYKTLTYPNLKAFVGSDGSAMVLIGGAILRIVHDGPDAYKVQVLRRASAGTSITPVGLRATSAPAPPPAHASSGTSQ